MASSISLIELLRFLIERLSGFLLHSSDILLAIYFELSEETKEKIADFTQAPSTAYALETLIKYYYVNRQEDTDWVVLPVANFDAYFGSTSFSKKRLTELVKSGAIERENSYNVSRYRLNEVFT